MAHWHTFHKKWYTKSTKHLNHQHLHALHNGIRRPHEVSPPISSSEATALEVILRMHGCLRLEEPLDHGIVASLGCQVQRCVASGAAARGQATGRNQPKEAEKKSEKIWAPQKSKFGKFWPLKNPPWTWGTLCFWGSFDDIELVERTVAFGFLAVKMSWIINQNIYSNSGAKSDPKVFISSYFYKPNYWDTGNNTILLKKNYIQNKLVQMSWHTGTLSIRSDTQNPRNT